MEDKKCIDCGIDIASAAVQRSKRCQKCRRKYISTLDSDKKRTKQHNLMLSYKSWTIYILYDGRCAICGWRAIEEVPSGCRGCTSKSFGNQIHHIIASSKNGSDDISNLILLCPNHHKQADWGIITIEELVGHQVPESEISITLKKNKEAIDLRKMKDKRMDVATEMADNLL